MTSNPEIFTPTICHLAKETKLYWKKTNEMEGGNLKAIRIKHQITHEI